MNLIRKSLFFAAATAFGMSGAFAVNWVYDNSLPGASTDLKWSATIGTADTPGYWKNSETGEYMQGSFSPTDSFSAGDDTYTQYVRIYLDSDVSIGSLYISGNGWDNQPRFFGEEYKYGITINGDLERSSSTFAGYLNRMKFVNITGNVTVMGSNFQIEAGTLNIGGKITGNEGTSIYLSLGSGTPTKSFDEGLATPDAVIGGVVDGAKLYQKANGRDTYLQLAGVSGSGGINREANPYGNTDNYTSYYILANTQDCTASGYIIESNNKSWKQDSGKASLVMNGTATQSFTGSQLMFQGGVTVISGTLKLNFAQDSGLYEHNYTYTDDKNRTKVTYFESKADGAARTTFSHGDLDLRGGTFGADDSSGYGSFRLTNIKYSGGTVKLRLDGADSHDSIDLTTYYAKLENIVESSVESSNWETYAGGSIQFAEGANTMVFDFGENLDWLIDAEGDGVKVIAWDEGKQGSLTSDNFSANNFSGDDGNLYEALFAVNGDGLYVKYVAVPEPATYAALLGLLALSVAYWRRTRK